MTSSGRITKAKDLINQAAYICGKPIGYDEGIFLSFLNNGLSDFCRKTEMFERVDAFTVEYTGNDNDRIFNLPREVVRILMVEYDGSVLQQMNFGDRDNLDTRFNTAATPKFFYRFKDSLWLYPPPDSAADQKEGRVFSVGIPDLIEDLEGDVETDPAYDSILTAYIVWHAAGDPSLRAQYRIDWEQGINEARRDVFRNRQRVEAGRVSL